MAFPTRTFQRSLSVIAVASASIALAACSASSPESSEEASPTTSAAISAPAILEDGVLKICASYGTPPNIFVEEDGTPVGAEVDLAKAMAEELGLTAEFSEFNFAGLVPALQAKQCDAIMSSLYIKPEREEIASFVPYLKSGSAVAVSNENPQKITGFDDSLCGTKVLAINGATGAVQAQEKSDECVAGGKEALDITLSDQGTAGLQQIVAGQVDAFIDTADLVGYYEQESDGAFKLIGESFGSINIGAATLKDNTELHDALTSSFAALVENGTYSEILTEWGLEALDINQAS